MTRVLLFALGTLMLALFACSQPAPTPSQGGASAKPAARPLVVACTTGMVADMVRAVAGERATVLTLMGAGVDPHLFKPTRADVAKVTGADAVFYNGLLLEGKMTETFDRLRSGGKPVVALCQDLAPADLLHDKPEPDAKQSAEKHHDPHVWMDPALWLRGVDIVESALAKLDPSSADLFKSNAAAYRESIRQLDAYAQKTLATVPEKSRVLITAHDAFGYFGRRFGFQVEGIQGISTESEAGVKDIQRLVDLIVSRDIKAVFVETSVSDRNIKALLAGAQAKGHTVVIGGSLYSDALGLPDTYEGTYIGMIDHNVTIIARALGGTAPERGMQNKLAAPKP